MVVNMLDISTKDIIEDIIFLFPKSFFLPGQVFGVTITNLRNLRSFRAQYSLLDESQPGHVVSVI